MDDALTIEYLRVGLSVLPDSSEPSKWRFRKWWNTLF